MTNSTANNKNRTLFIVLFCLLPISGIWGQQIAVKSNLLYDLTSTISLGGEIKCDNTHTLSIMMSYNPWEFGDNKKMKHFLIQPEYRKWFDEIFMGSFIGFQAHYGMFNFGGIPPAKNNRYQGNLVGVGVSYGYQWMIGPQWNLEAGISLGYAQFSYKHYDRPRGAPLIEKTSYHYWGPTQIGISLVYFIQ